MLFLRHWGRKAASSPSAAGRTGFEAMCQPELPHNLLRAPPDIPLVDWEPEHHFSKGIIRRIMFFQANWLYGSGCADEIAARQHVSYPSGWQGALGTHLEEETKTALGECLVQQGSGGLPVPTGKDVMDKVDTLGAGWMCP